MGHTWEPSPWAIGIVTSALFSAWRWTTLEQPPLWDNAMGLAPAAITLEQTGFDVTALMQMRDFHGGGPNVHPLSLFTWFTAVCIRLFGTYQAALPTLHLVSFALIGVLTAAVYRLVFDLTTDRTLSVLTCLAVVLYPPLVVQGSAVYLDLPLAAACMWCLALALEGRWTRAVVALSIGAVIKPTAITLVPPLLVLLAFRKRWSWMPTLLLPVLIAVAPLAASPALRVMTDWPARTVGEVTARTLMYLSHMPLFLALIVSLAVIYLSMSRRSRSSDSGPFEPGLLALVLVISHVAFFCLNPLLSKGVPGLPRYTVVVAPIVCVAIVTGIERLHGRVAGFGTGFLLIVLFAFNMQGRLEPDSGNLFPLAERSLAYEDFLAVQQEALGQFVLIADSIPAIYDHFTHYRLAYPEQGWVVGTPPRGTPIVLQPRRLVEMPDRFVALIEADWLGGVQLRSLAQQAMGSPDWQVHVDSVSSGNFINEVVRVTRMTN